MATNLVDMQESESKMWNSCFLDPTKQSRGRFAIQGFTPLHLSNNIHRSMTFFLDMKASTLITFCLLLLTSACTIPKFQNPNDKVIEVPTHAVVFNRIDETATVTVNGEVVYENELLLRQSDDPIVVDIKEFLRVGENNVEITLSDTPEGRCMNNEWGINYDLHINGEIFDYWQQQNDGFSCEDGIKVRKEYTVEVASL